MANRKELRLLRLIAENGGAMSHDEKELDPFSDDNGRKADTFNRCSAQGWIRSTHNNDTDESVSYLTPEGRKVIETESQQRHHAMSIEQLHRAVVHKMANDPAPWTDDVNAKLAAWRKWRRRFSGC